MESLSMPDWLEAQVLRREAESLLGEELPALTPLAAILRGQAEPADVAEAISLADVCTGRHRYGDSARLWEWAFAAAPRLAEDPLRWNRFDAALVLGLASLHGNDGEPPPDEATRAHWRSRALGWLRAELAAWSQALESGNPEARAVVDASLRHCQAHPALAGVRDADSLAALPERERAAWRAFWAEAQALLRRAGRA
jgi:hypothetical protein